MTTRMVCMLIALGLGAASVVPVHSEPGVALISQEQLLHQMASQSHQLILDVRTPQEFQAGHVPGAMNIPHTDLARRLDEVRQYQAKEVVVYCELGGRAGVAGKILQDAGFSRLRHLEGDMAAWRQQQRPTEVGTPSR